MMPLFLESLLMALVGAAVLIPLIVETDETTKHLKAIQRIYVEANPNAYGWSFDKFRLAFRERRPPEDWSKELEYHRGKLVELGYFEVVELPIPDKESLKQFALLVDQQSTNFQCTYWSYSSQTEMVRVTAFKGDLPIWRRVGEEARRAAGSD